jgi:hypothetical protein
LLRLVQAHCPFRSFGCAYPDKLLSVPGSRIDTVGLNRQFLYSDQHFALVTCVETIEHLENYRAVIREIYRVLQIPTPLPVGISISDRSSALCKLDRLSL